MWDFVRDREDLQAIGYPISQRWTEGPFTLQAFQKVILQWDPGKQRMNYYNTLDALANRYPHVQLPFVPPHQVLEEDQGADFATITRNHLAILDQNPAIKERFLSEPDWLNLYGLPIRYEEREVAGNPQGVQTLRTQRTVFVIWNVPAPGTTVGRVILQNVPDKVKNLTNVVIPDAAKTPTPAADPQPLMNALPWIADGIAPADQTIIDHLQRIAAAAPELFWRILRDEPVEWLQRPPNAQTIAATGVLVAIAEFPWTHRQIGGSERDLLRLLLHTPDDQWPVSLRQLMQKPWMTDGITWDELRLADWFVHFALAYPTNRESTYQGQYQAVDDILQMILHMPFLDTFEGYEHSIIYRLASDHRDLGYYQDAMSSFASNGGITDEQALLFMYLYLGYSEVLGPNLVDWTKPGTLGHELDPRALAINIERRDIILPRSGDMLLALVWDRPISDSMMDDFERIAREVETGMDMPYRVDQIVLLIHPILSLGIHRVDNVGIGPRHFEGGQMSAAAQGILAHELVHYYYSYGVVDFTWITEGVPMLLELDLGYARLEEITEIAEACPNAISDLDFENPDPSKRWCHDYLGARFFLELSQELDQGAFRKGFETLPWLLREEMYCWSPPRINGQCPIVWPVSPVDVVREAFTEDAAPDVVAIVEAALARWYFGEEPP